MMSMAPTKPSSPELSPASSRCARSTAAPCGIRCQRSEWNGAGPISRKLSSLYKALCLREATTQPLMTTIAMWSGPRNISTAMMYAFGNRADCVAWDEPFYAFSLVNHGNDHPMRDEIIAANESDWDGLLRNAPAPVGKARLLPEAHDPPHAAGL